MFGKARSVYENKPGGSPVRLEKKTSYLFVWVRDDTGNDKHASGKEGLAHKDRPVRPGFPVSPALHIGKRQCAFLVCMPEESKKRSSSCYFGDYLDWQSGHQNGSLFLWSGNRDVSVCSISSLWSQRNPISAGSYLSTVPLLYSGHCLSLCVV